MKIAALGILLAPAGWAAISNVTVKGVSSTQAILSYTAPDQNACTVEVSEQPSYTPLVNDVNPALFAGSNLDNRPGSVTEGRARQVVIGRRAAEVALDQKRYSRALQVLTEHYYRIQCGADEATGRFRTGNIPLGSGYFDPVPVDPNEPGTTAWPSFYGRNRSDAVIDPQTGLKVRRGVLPQDQQLTVPNAVVLEAQDMSGSGWTPSGCASATLCITADDGNGVVNSTGNGGAFFISNRSALYFQQKSYEQNASYDWIKLNLKAWCSGPSCAGAPAADRTVEVCLTVNRTTCEGEPIPVVLGTSAPGTPTVVGDSTPILQAWTLRPERLNSVEMGYFSGTASVANGSTTVNWLSGDVFSIWWTAGSVIKLGGVNYTISSVQNSRQLTLATAYGGSTGGVGFEANNTGFLVRKATASADAITLQHATFDYAYSVVLRIDSSGIQQLSWTCSPVSQDLGGGVMGKLCLTNLGMYAVEDETGIHRSLGTVGIYVPGVYPAQGCPLGASALSAVVFDGTDANKFYCLGVDTSGRSSIFAVKYFAGSVFTDIGPANFNSYRFLGQTCNGSHTNVPCVDITNLTPPPNHLEAQLAVLHPDWPLAPTKFIAIGGRQGSKIGLWGHMGTQDTRGWNFVFDPATAQVVAAAPTFRYWPSRWAGIHSWNNIQDPNWLRQPIGDLVTHSTALSGDDTPGLGPYGAAYLGYHNGSTFVAGAMPATGQACPERPADSPIPVSEWPTGGNCIRIQTDGQTCDPSPGVWGVGTLQSGATLSDITGASTGWYPALEGKPIVINGMTYTFHFVTPTTGTISPAPASAFPAGTTYKILVEDKIGDSRCGSATAFYLQDVAVRDVLMASSTTPYGWLTAPKLEFFRVLKINGPTDWWLERGYKGQSYSNNWGVNTMLWQFQASCNFTFVSYSGCDVEWNFTADPLGMNATGTTMVPDLNNFGGHTGSAFGPGFVGMSVAPYALPFCTTVTDWKGFPQRPCYQVRTGNVPDYVNAGNFFVSSMPTFSGLLGIGVPNGVDSHPTVNHIAAAKGEQLWFLDARPMNGDNFMVGTAGSPGINVSGYLWKFTLAQRGCSTAEQCRKQRKVLPTMATINRYPLVDISSAATGDVIGTGKADWFKYCIAERVNECRNGSAVGDLYINGPISQPYCAYPGIAVGGGAVYDPCIGPMAAFTHSIVQIGVQEGAGNDWKGSLTRVLTHGLSRYRWMSPFWNVRSSEDGKWLFFRADWLDGVRSEWMVTKLPPMPARDSVNRNDFIPVKVSLTPPQGEGIATAVVEFGYAEHGTPDQYFCTSRRETCVKGNQADNDFDYAGDNVTGVACATGCTITVPAISQRVLYYRYKYRDGSGATKWTSRAHVKMVP